MEHSCGRPVYSSVNIITQPAHSEHNLSAHSIPQWSISKDGDEQDKYKQDIPAAQYIQDKYVPEYKMSTRHIDNKDTLTKDVQSVHAGPEYLVCRRPMDGEASPGELVQMVASTQSQAPTESHRSTMHHPGLAGEQAQRETPEDHKAREGVAPCLWSLVQNSESNLTPSLQSIDFLPTFTSQRPPDLPTTMGKRALSNTRNVNNNAPYDHRYV